MRLLALLFAAFLSLVAAREAQATVTIRVDKTTQTMNVTSTNGTTYNWKVSSGRRGYETPRGTYSPYRMHTMWRSKKYHNSPMPHSIFFHGGYAIHGTGAIGNLGRVASHGCIRLHPANAKALFELVKADTTGTQIIIDASTSSIAAAPATKKTETVAQSGSVKKKVKHASLKRHHKHKAIAHAPERGKRLAMAPALSPSRSDDGSIYGAMRSGRMH